MKEDYASIKSLFEPRSVAVIGASPNPDKIGYKILDNIISDGFKGKIYPVNPRGGEVLGLKAYTSVEEIEGDVDVAVTVVPEKLVAEANEQCGRKGVKHNLIITSGFSEIGNNEEEKRIIATARSYGMRVVGPNIFGVYSAAASLNTTFGPKGILPGNVAIITQSGALGIAMISKAAAQNIGLSAIVSVGNKADIDEADLLEYLIRDEQTKVVLLYVEGVKDGQRMIEAFRKTTLVKPIVVVKAGRSARGAMAAASHTGALAGSDEIFDHVMKQCGVVRAENVKEAFEWCNFFATTPIPAGESTVIITNGGGLGVLATDACEKYGVKLYDDYDRLKATYSSAVPYFGSTKNPVDLTGGATSGQYDGAFKVSLQNEAIDAVIGLYCETAVFDIDNFGQTILDNRTLFVDAKKPLVICLVGGTGTDACVDRLRKKGVPAFTDPYEAVSCLGAMFTYKNYLRERTDEIDTATVDVEAINAVLAKARAEKRRFLLSNEGQAVMEAAGISIPKSRISRNLDEAVRFAEEIGYPVVMKVVSKDILHKSDVGGVALDLENKNEVIEAYEAILHNCLAHNPHAHIDGIEVAEMVKKGTELIVGAKRDPSFGPIVMVGLGGIYVEVMKDVSFRALPLSPREKTAMLKEIRSYPLLLGVRGEDKKDIDSVLATIVKVGTIIQKCEGISDIEINPVVVYPDGVKAVDARILLTTQER